ncbi:hypothetical protein PanWU01x14_068140 [Parasponia andersonii]|uniref:Transmembrane protein n=1 Tax=Parasponia andersonii TaxID=3476 RepID=A0A2P5DFA1_PARAD|nr:hypothetical protein PanWU01x14_068140 [Parasponia andersonii]
MAAGTLSITLPVVAAAVGLYLCERSHFKTKKFGTEIRSSFETIAAKARVEVKTSQMPKLAPQFDGLDCFETFVC